MLRRAALRAAVASGAGRSCGSWLLPQLSGVPGSWGCSAAYSQPAAAADDQVDEPPPERVQQLADDIMGLTVLECSQLSAILRERLGVPRGAAVPMMGMPFAAGPAPGAAAPSAAQEEAPKPEAKEKTEFDVKLESFSPEGKIKVIKEIRAITSLGLKEAKELVRTFRSPSGGSAHGTPPLPASFFCRNAPPPSSLM